MGISIMHTHGEAEHENFIKEAPLDMRLFERAREMTTNPTSTPQQPTMGRPQEDQQ